MSVYRLEAFIIKAEGHEPQHPGDPRVGLVWSCPGPYIAIGETYADGRFFESVAKITIKHLIAAGQRLVLVIYGSDEPHSPDLSLSAIKFKEISASAERWAPARHKSSKRLLLPDGIPSEWRAGHE